MEILRKVKIYYGKLRRVCLIYPQISQTKLPSSQIQAERFFFYVAFSTLSTIHQIVLNRAVMFSQFLLCTFILLLIYVLYNVQYKYNWIFLTEGLFDQYICDQDYTPKWTPIEPLPNGKVCRSYIMISKISSFKIFSVINIDSVKTIRELNVCVHSWAQW